MEQLDLVHLKDVAVDRRPRLVPYGWAPPGIPKNRALVLGGGDHELPTGIYVEHCGHPTALRPWHVTTTRSDLVVPRRKFRLLREASEAALELYRESTLPRCEGGCTLWKCDREAGHPGPCQPAYDERERTAIVGRG